jgi:replicative DNA helicase
MAAPAKVQVLPKHPPHSLEAEQCVLGAILLSPQHWELVAPLVRVEDFYRADHQLIFRAASKFLTAGKQCDFIVLTDALRQEGRLDEAGGAGYLASLAVDTYSLSSVEAHAGIVAEHAKRRRIIALCSEVADAAYGRNAPSALVEQLNIGLEHVGRADLGKAKTFAEVLDAADKAISLAKEKRAAGGLLGAPTGILCVDQRTGGLRRGKLYIVAARPSLGKSALLNQIAVHAAQRAHPGFVASLEMTDDELGTRAMASAAAVNVTRLSFGADEERDRACQAATALMSLPLWVDTDTYDLAGICAQIAHAKRVHGITWAAVDHIGLVETEAFNNRNDQLGVITRTFKKLAKKLDIAIVALSQLNRTVEKDRRWPMLADLRDSGNVEQDADVCLFLHTDALDSESVIPMKFGLLKNRGGRRGWIKKRIDFDGAKQRFIETEFDYEDHLRQPAPPSGGPHRRSGKDAAAGGDS